MAFLMTLIPKKVRARLPPGFVLTSSLFRLQLSAATT
jgi:hypothetical protein